MNTLLSVSRIYELLRTVDDPEIGINIVDLGFIYVLEWTEAALKAETDQGILIDADSARSPTDVSVSRNRCRFIRPLDPGMGG